MTTMILKYNTRVATDPQGAIEGFVQELGLRIESVRVVDGRPGNKLKEIVVSGDAFQIASLGKSLARFAAVSSKIVEASGKPNESLSDLAPHQDPEL